MKFSHPNQFMGHGFTWGETKPIQSRNHRNIIGIIFTNPRHAGWVAGFLLFSSWAWQVGFRRTVAFTKWSLHRHLTWSYWSSAVGWMPIIPSNSMRTSKGHILVHETKFNVCHGNCMNFLALAVAFPPSTINFTDSILQVQPLQECPLDPPSVRPRSILSVSIWIRLASSSATASNCQSWLCPTPKKWLRKLACRLGWLIWGDVILAGYTVIYDLIIWPQMKYVSAHKCHCNENYLQL